MIFIRLKKISSKKNLSYHLVVASNEVSSTSGKFKEKVGFFKPIIDKWSNKYVFVDIDRLSFWLKKGVKINASVFILLKPLIIYSFGKKINSK